MGNISWMAGDKHMDNENISYMANNRHMKRKIQIVWRMINILKRKI